MSANTRLDDCLSKRSSHLFVENCDTIELVQQFGSPIFVLSEDQIRRNVRRFQQAFQQGWPEGVVKVLPAAKANWALAVQRILAEEGCGCDVYSTGELGAAAQARRRRERAAGELHGLRRAAGLPGEWRTFILPREIENYRQPSLSLEHSHNTPD